MMIHSYDIFDTTLIRDTLAPSGVFERLYHDLKRSHADFDRISVADFIACRINAENLARRMSDTEETTLENIWVELCQMLGLRHSLDYPAKELECEARALHVVADTRHRIETSRAQGQRIIFISDTYLPLEFLKAVLIKHSLFLPSDHIYASSVVGKTKASGSLFRHVLTQERIGPDQLTHYGDHIDADIRVPRSLGITVQHCMAPALSRITVATLDTRSASGGLTAALAGYGRKFKLQFQYDGDAAPGPVLSLVGDFLGPLCELAAAWALSRAQALGMKKLYFAARDGRMIWIAARFLAPRFGNIDCLYLHQSRRSLLLPSVLETDHENLAWLKPKYETMTLDKVLSRLGLDRGDLAGCGKTPSIKPDSVIATEEQWAECITLLNSPSLRVKILERASKLRQTALDYFRSIGMFDGEPFGIFDLGWYLTCQTALRRIIRSAGNDCFVGGLYLGLHIERQPPVIAGYSEAVCHTPAPDMLGSYKPFHLDSHLATLLEAFLGLAEHPTTAGYDESGPVFERESRSPESMAMIQEIHRMIENYCTHMVPDLIFPENDERDCKFAITSLVAAFFDNPCKEILNISASISMSSALEGEPARPLVRPLGWADLCEALRGREDLRRQSFWPAADKMVSSPMMRLAIGAVRTLWGRTRNALSS